MSKQSLVEPHMFFLDVPTAGGGDTHRLALYEWKSGSCAKGTVFCVHGLTRNGRDFDLMASVLSADYNVFSIDVAGRGKSRWHSDPAHYNYGDYVADIGHVAVKLGLSSINWIGTSMGGIIGMMVANTFPKLLRTLTLNDIGCLIPADGLARIARYAGSATDFASRAQAEAELRTRCAPYGISDEAHWRHLFTHSIVETGDGRAHLAYDPAISRNLFTPGKPIEDVNLWQLWEAVKPIPTLLIRGMESDLLTHRTAIEMEKSHPDFSLLEIENVGHAPALLDTGQISVIKNWLECH